MIGARVGGSREWVLAAPRLAKARVGLWWHGFCRPSSRCLAATAAR